MTWNHQGPGSADHSEAVVTEPTPGSTSTSPETDPPVLTILLEVKPGLDGGSDRVECGSCAAGWQVPHHAESVR